MGSQRVGLSDSYLTITIGVAQARSMTLSQSKHHDRKEPNTKYERLTPKETEVKEKNGHL